MTKEEISELIKQSLIDHGLMADNIEEFGQIAKEYFLMGYGYATKEKEELEAENFRLAAMACIKPTGDDYGNRTCDDKSQCTMIERVRQLESDQEKQGWVKTKGVSLEVGKSYLVYRPYANDLGDEVITICKWVGGISFDHKDLPYQFERSHYVSHYMELPQKPEV
jgi:regulator of RNase E activity RraB